MKQNRQEDLEDVRSDMVRWQNEAFFIDPLPAMQALGYSGDDLPAAIRDTVRATLEFGGQGPGRLAVAGNKPG